MFDAWNLKTLQEYLNIRLHLSHINKTDEDIKRYIENLLGNKEKSFIEKPIRKCPQCNGILKLFSLNKKERISNPGMESKWECCKTCSSESCGYIEYNQESIEKILNVEE